MNDFNEIMFIRDSEMYVIDKLVETSRIFAERNQRYKSLWTSDGVEGNANMVRHKALRVYQQMKNRDNRLIEDCMDLINYALFTMFCAEKEMWEPSDDNAL